MSDTALVVGVMVQRPHVRRTAGECVNVGDVVQQAGADPRYANTPLPWFDVWCTEHELIERVMFYDDEHGMSPDEAAAELQRARTFACWTAARHARDLHDDIVDRDGWT